MQTSLEHKVCESGQMMTQGHLFALVVVKMNKYKDLFIPALCDFLGC